MGNNKVTKRIRIVSSHPIGDFSTTKVFDADTGDEINCVRAVEITMIAGQPARIACEPLLVELDVVADLDQVDAELLDLAKRFWGLFNKRREEARHGK